MDASELENVDVLTLLISWGFSDLADNFAGKGIDLEALKLLTVDDLIRLIPDTQFGLRIKFRKKLDDWRIENAFADGSSTTTLTGDTLSITSIQSWPFIDGDSGQACALVTKTLNLSTILNTSLSGKDIVEYYSMNKYLTKGHRNTLTTLICESISKARRFYIFFNDVLYETESFLKAVSITFQMHYVLNIEYAKECHQMWLFIQQHFYELQITDLKKTSGVKTLINHFK